MIAPPASIAPGTDAYRRWYAETVQREPSAKAGIVAWYNAWKAAGGKPPAPPAPKDEPVPREKWPKWAQLLAELAIPEDAGVGDVIHRHAGAAGEAYIRLRKAIKWPCGCTRRRAAFNARYPLR